MKRITAKLTPVTPSRGGSVYKVLLQKVGYSEDAVFKHILDTHKNL